MTEPRPKKPPASVTPPQTPAVEDLTLAAIQEAVESIRHDVVQIITDVTQMHPGIASGH